MEEITGLTRFAFRWVVAELSPGMPTAHAILTSLRHLLLAAGLEGIREKIDPGEPQEENLYELNFMELAARGICELPRTLNEAVEAFAADPFIEQALGPELRQEFVTYKGEEWRDYHQQISQWEVDKYARLF